MPQRQSGKLETSAAVQSALKAASNIGIIMETKEAGLARPRGHLRLHSRSLGISILSLAIFLASVGLAGCGGYTTANTQSTSSKPLSAGPTSLSFGNILVGGTSTLSLTLKDTGTASVAVSQTVGNG